MDTPLRRIRKARNLRLEDVARKCRIDKGNISRIERGEQQPSKKTAERLVKFYRGQITQSQIFAPGDFPDWLPRVD